ncbi:hypothetical protein P175DRAFT_0558111 [Aspergillus ochraceoroseus IBT 24754]|uniref:Uncharacterized protein n=1 Tax=Aspergillus ochraceoroseus IBT 24754 TaxID=1392256 RepID=A0A2T5LUE6_9EURO|nr:uncharacterized protein P175DRAFT_0558111 [Aspergillus ochraceoroseus IBT 24754]PTU19904.1 hypothetical protein P175DRAFT_0558111 [Aspergillus ochraceoroseus IBT 24754]
MIVFSRLCSTMPVIDSDGVPLACVVSKVSRPKDPLRESSAYHCFNKMNFYTLSRKLLRIPPAPCLLSWQAHSQGHQSTAGYQLYSGKALAYSQDTTDQDLKSQKYSVDTETGIFEQGLPEISSVRIRLAQDYVVHPSLVGMGPNVLFSTAGLPTLCSLDTCLSIRTYDVYGSITFDSKYVS